jgi:hypothetical protein
MQGNRDKPIGAELIRMPVASQQLAKWIGQAGPSFILETMDTLPQRPKKKGR